MQLMFSKKLTSLIRFHFLNYNFCSFFDMNYDEQVFILIFDFSKFETFKDYTLPKVIMHEKMKVFIRYIYKSMHLHICNPLITEKN